jgi:hypothetical protein
MLYSAKRPCPFCQKSISAKATVCPCCTREVQPGKKISIGKVVLVGFGVMLLFGMLLDALVGGGDTAPSQRRIGCGRAVKARLKAPTTAKFEWTGFWKNSDTTEGLPYVTTGKVTSENSFGARLTHEFACFHDGQNGGRVKIDMDE